MTNQPQSEGGQSRRDFLKTTAAAGAALTTTLLPAGGVHAAGSDLIRVGLIGCGGRGTGAAENVLRAARGVAVVALGDVFKDNGRGGGVDHCRRSLLKLQGDEQIKELGNKVDLP